MYSASVMSSAIVIFSLILSSTLSLSVKIEKINIHVLVAVRTSLDVLSWIYVYLLPEIKVNWGPVGQDH